MASGPGEGSLLSRDLERSRMRPPGDLERPRDRGSPTWSDMDGNELKRDGKTDRKGSQLGARVVLR